MSDEDYYLFSFLCFIVGLNCSELSKYSTLWDNAPLLLIWECLLLGGIGSRSNKYILSMIQSFSAEMIIIVATVSVLTADIMLIKTFDIMFIKTLP